MSLLSPRFASAGILTAVTAAAVLATSFLPRKLIFAKTAYQVSRVLDGDTFEISTGQKIRLSNIEAPEIDLCGGQAAKDQLERLIGNHQVHLKIYWIDSFDRLTADVYADNMWVNAQMLSGGFALYHGRDVASANRQLLQLASQARVNKLGIFGPLCTQTTNPDNPKCHIKGNVKNRNGRKYYHLPTCGHYAETSVDLYLGDQWFCTETQAQKAGFTKADACP